MCWQTSAFLLGLIIGEVRHHDGSGTYQESSVACEPFCYQVLASETSRWSPIPDLIVNDMGSIANNPPFSSTERVGMKRDFNADSRQALERPASKQNFRQNF